MRRAIVLISLNLMLWLAPLSAQSPTQNSSSFTIHVVQRDETLTAIAQQYNVSSEILLDLNSLTNSEDIRVGQRLLIPTGATLQTDELTHIVQTGETLRSIAELYGKSTADLSELNDITDPDRIFVGQTLKIGTIALEPTQQPAINATPSPNEESATLADTTAPTPPTPSPSPTPLPPVFHTVRPGDTLLRIASRYDLTIDAMIAANNLTNPELIFAGQRLIVPGLKPPQLVTALPQQVNQINFNPLVFVEGETGSVEIRTTPLQFMSGKFLDRPLTIISRENSTLHNILIPVPVFTEVGIYPLELQLIDTNKETASVTVNIQVIGGNYGAQNIEVSDPTLLDPAVEEFEINLLTRITSQVTPERFWDGSLSLPSAAAMNGPFGTRRSYNNGPFERFHRGIDFAGGPGTPILAAAPGRVVVADTLTIRGTTTVIDHGWGVFTLYAHQNERFVDIGDFVTTGQTIGTVGSTGRVTGPHLHWEVWVNSVTVNPAQWLQDIFP